VVVEDLGGAVVLGGDVTHFKISPGTTKGRNLSAPALTLLAP
jgi:hypothetical protein